MKGRHDNLLYYLSPFILSALHKTILKSVIKDFLLILYLK